MNKKTKFTIAFIALMVIVLVINVFVCACTDKQLAARAEGEEYYTTTCEVEFHTSAVASQAVDTYGLYTCTSHYEICLAKNVVSIELAEPIEGARFAQNGTTNGLAYKIVGYVAERVPNDCITVTVVIVSTGTVYLAPEVTNYTSEVAVVTEGLNVRIPELTEPTEPVDNTDEPIDEPTEPTDEPDTPIVPEEPTDKGKIDEILDKLDKVFTKDMGNGIDAFWTEFKPVVTSILGFSIGGISIGAILWYVLKKRFDKIVARIEANYEANTIAKQVTDKIAKTDISVDLATMTSAELGKISAVMKSMLANGLKDVNIMKRSVALLCGALSHSKTLTESERAELAQEAKNLDEEVAKEQHEVVKLKLEKIEVDEEKEEKPTENNLGGWGNDKA